MVRNWLGCKTVYLVESDSAVRDGLRCFLESKGFLVQEMGSALEALHFLQDHIAPGFFVLDSHLADIPIADLRRELDRCPPLMHMPVVVLAARDDLSVTEHANVDLLYRPVEAEAVFLAIKKLTMTERPEILLVEDERGVREFLSLALLRGGFLVRQARNGQEALSLYRQHAEDFAGVLMDVQMPELDGPSTLRAMKEIKPGIPCCFMSGNTGKYSVGDLLAMGAAHVMLKPFASIDKLACTLWDVLEL